MTLFLNSNVLRLLPAFHLHHTWGKSGNKASNILVCLLLFRLLNTFASISLYDYISVDCILVF